MKSLKKIVLVGCLFIFGCEGGFLNTNLGSENFVALTDRMNSDIRLKQNSIQQLQSGTRFVDFQIKSIEAVERFSNNEASVKFSEYNIETDFNRAEIIITDIRISDSEGNSFNTTITFLFGTIDDYYSELDFPIDKLFSVAEYPPFDNFENRLYVSYQHNDLSFGLKQSLRSTLNRSGNALNFQFSQIEFLLFDGDFGIIDENTIGSGKISSERISRLPRF
ncbi:MAG: hypothetical protein ABJ387_07705 [Balneola sp.]